MRRNAGFTLLEMLVALVVFGLVMDGLAQTFRFGLMAWTAGPAKTAEPENLAALDAALSRMISQTLPGSMAGRANQLAFTTHLPAGAGLNGGLADVVIIDLANGDLVLRYRPHPAGIRLTPPPVPHVEILAEHVSSLRVAYLGKSAPAAKIKWSSKWKGLFLPILVRLHIQLQDDREWPDLIVAPVNTGS